MDKPRPPARPPARPAPQAHNPDNCLTCGKPIDVFDVVWIKMGAGVDAGVEHDRCR